MGVKHILLARFKEGVTDDQIEELIKAYANLVNLIEPLKDLEWGTNVSTRNLNQGFTHAFESNFESTEAIDEFLSHPAHVEFKNLFVPQLEKFLVIDYVPTGLHP